MERQVIEQAASKWEVTFPEEYIRLAQQYHGARPTLHKIDIPARPGAIFQNLLSYRTRPRERDDDMSIFETVQAVFKRLPPRVIPFGGDPFGNLFCFDYQDSDANPKCVFWDHEKAFKNPQKAILPVCDTFSRFIGMLY